MRMIILLLLLTGMLKARSQQKVFTEDELMNMIRKFHPVARQAAIDVEIARAQIILERGGFDPMISKNISQKESGGLRYYNHEALELNVPAWYGVEFYAGREKITGDRVNPEETKGTVTYLGLSVQPLQNLLMDKRRADLLKAKNFQLFSEVQQRNILNDLYREALTGYWEWWGSYQKMQVVNAALENAEKRMALVRTAFQLGDRAAIDTLEAFTQVQQFQVQFSESCQEHIQNSIQLSALLWTDDGKASDLPFDVIPQPYKDQEPLMPDIFSVINDHPQVKQFELRLNELEIDKKLAFQSLLPQVKLRYNQSGTDLSKTITAPWFDNNYRYGISLSMPLRLSEGRGKYRVARLKMEAARTGQANMRVMLSARIRKYLNEWQQLKIQLETQSHLLANTKTLQRAEELRFSIGESSLFMINAREQKTIEAERKLIELKTKVQKAATDLKWSAGILAQ